MDGTAIDFIIIPIVAILITVAWPALVLWADARQAKTHRNPQATAAQASVVPRATAVALPRHVQAPAEEQIPAHAGRQ